ncbi:hypothetical protein PHYPO_G00213010 [Pangasianodon hypophthalmus]|uniref:Uncharacterized protein n=1 Tax=Pangasianodon hypophthalmus TaxID=310915 RepID=A0A5N5P5A5_PANHP|nr:hypothetical protein PHYPO_G00213010 [Pangasianodon hypophthalmus]
MSVWKSTRFPGEARGGGAWRMRTAHTDHTRLSRDVYSASTMQHYTNTPAGRRRESSSASCKHRAHPRLTLWISAALLILNMG